MLHLNSNFHDEALPSFPLRPASELENSQTYILKPLQRHAWITLNENNLIYLPKL